MNTSLQYQHEATTPVHLFQHDNQNTFAYLRKPCAVAQSGLLTTHLDDEPRDHSSVDFSPRFKRLKAKIDAITFSCSKHDLTPGRVASLRGLIKDGRLETPRDRRYRAAGGCPWLAVQDPSLRDLKLLVERFWESRVMRIEVALDASLPEGSNELWRLERLKGQLRHCLYPQLCRGRGLVRCPSFCPCQVVQRDCFKCLEQEFCRFHVECDCLLRGGRLVNKSPRLLLEGRGKRLGNARVLGYRRQQDELALPAQFHLGIADACGQCAQLAQRLVVAAMLLEALDMANYDLLEPGSPAPQAIPARC